MRNKKTKFSFINFAVFTKLVSDAVGSFWSFVIALLFIIIWAIMGPFFKFSDTWQLVINTSTTIITFLMVFIIQNTQNRDNLAINIKLDAILKKLNVTDQELIQAEDESDKDLEKQKASMQKK